MTFIRKIFEWIDSPRRKQLDAWGYKEWVKSGARHSHPTLLGAFENAATPKQGSSLQLVTLGKLTVRSGRILTFWDVDVLEAPNEKESTRSDLKDADSFEQIAPTGDHVLEALFLSEKLAALRLNFVSSDRSIAYLEPAWGGNCKENCLQHYRLECWIVCGDSSGIGALVTPEAASAFRNSTISDPRKLAPNRSLYPGVNPSNCWQETRFDDGSNLFTFYPGNGGGFYWCFFAKAEDGSPTALIADFGFFGQPMRLKLSRS
jgi:hypothetical protein